jgi:hypothetical protein
MPTEPPADDLNMYRDLTHDQIAHLHLFLIIDRALRQRLVAFRENPPVKPRPKDLLEQAGLRVKVLRAGSADPKEREAWIARKGRDADVIIRHPRLVSARLDLEEGGGRAQLHPDHLPRDGLNPVHLVVTLPAGLANRPAQRVGIRESDLTVNKLRVEVLAGTET